MKRTAKLFILLAFSICLILTSCPNSISAEVSSQLTTIDTQSKIAGTGFSIINESTNNDRFVSRIAVPSLNTASKVSVGYVNVGLEGNGSGTMYAKLWKVGTIKNPKITVNLQRKYTGGSWTVITKKTFTSIGSIATPSKISASTNKTAFWKVTLSGSLNGGNVTYSTYEFLYNKKAVRYPDYTDSGSKKKLTVPATNLSVVPVSQRVSWTSTDRKNYISWYNKNYPNKINDWSKYQIHHIKPRQYGGTNSNSNLIPLLTTYHQKTVSPWWSNY